VTGAPANAKPSTSPSATSRVPGAVTVRMPPETGPGAMLSTVKTVATPFKVIIAPATSPSRKSVSSVMVSELNPNPKLLAFETLICSDNSTVLLGRSESPTRVRPVIPVPTTLTLLTTPLASSRTTRSVVTALALTKMKLMISSATTVMFPERLTSSPSIPSAATTSPSGTPFLRTVAPTSCPS